MLWKIFAWYGCLVLFVQVVIVAGIFLVWLENKVSDWMMGKMTRLDGPYRDG